MTIAGLPAWSVVCSAFALGFLLRKPRIGGPRRRTGGYVRPGASFGRNPAVSPALLEALTTGSFSLHWPPGEASEAWFRPRLLHDPSRLTGRGWSTLGTVTRGTSGRLPQDAA